MAVYAPVSHCALALRDVARALGIERGITSLRIDLDIKHTARVEVAFFLKREDIGALVRALEAYRLVPMGPEEDTSVSV